MFNLEFFALGYFIGGAFPMLRGVQRGCIVELYQNGCYDELSNEHFDTVKILGCAEFCIRMIVSSYHLQV